MKALFPVLTVLILAGCTRTNHVTHRQDFRPSKTKGAWTDYRAAIERGEEPQPPKEKK